ncbi:MAG: Ger(x)C family spore germination protein [Caulobacteraceae bacterium]
MKANNRLKLLVILLCILLTAGCWDKIEIEDRLFVLAIGVDKTQESEKKTPEDRYMLSFVSPVVSQVNEGSGPAFKTYKTVNNTLITSLSQLLERFAKQQFFGHARVMIFGEELLKDDVLFRSIVDGITRYHEMHGSMYTYVVPGGAEEVFKVEPYFDKLLASYITGITDNSQYDSKIPKLTLMEMEVKLNEQDGSLIIPRLVPDEKEVKISGAGIMKDYKLIGYLKDEETAVYNWLTGNARGGNIAVEFENAPLSFRHFTFKRNIRLDKVEGDKIYLSYNMETEGSIEEYILGKRILDDTKLRQIEKAINKRIKSESEKLIKKFKEEYKIDMIGAKDYLSKYHPGIYKSIEKDYEKNFAENIIITVKADARIRRVGLIK